MPRSPGWQVMVPILDLAVKPLSGTRGQEKGPLRAGGFGGSTSRRAGRSMGGDLRLGRKISTLDMLCRQSDRQWGLCWVLRHPSFLQP